MPHLENEIWKQLKDNGVVVLAVGREHSPAELKDFAAANNLTMPVIADTKREIYAKYAKRSIPRNYVVDGSGNIIYASIGFEPNEFAKMLRLVAKAANVSLPQSGVDAASASRTVNSGGSLQTAKGLPPSSSSVDPLRTSSSASPSFPQATAPSTEPSPLRDALNEISAKDFNAAIAHLKELIGKSPQSAQAHYLLAVAYAGNKNYDLAIQEYRSSLKLANNARLKELSEKGLEKLHAKP